jgi:DNA invertase Pin-like site-specific DNA recombinase
VLTVLSENDALIVTRLDRLGRSLRDLANIAHAIEQTGTHLKVLGGLCGELGEDE